MNSAQQPVGKASGSIQLWIQVETKASEKVGLGVVVILVGGLTDKVDMGDNKK